MIQTRFDLAKIGASHVIEMQEFKDKMFGARRQREIIVSFFFPLLSSVGAFSLGAGS